MNERSVHVYARVQGFAVVPLCRQLDGTWVECQPVQHVTLTRGRATSVYLGRAIDEASQHPCAAPQPLESLPGNWREHHLLAVRVIWGAESIQLLKLPDLDLLTEWPADFARELIARRIIAELGQVLT
jgi:hypothetical protein